MKKTATLLLIFSMMLTLCGCGEKNQEVQAESESEAETAGISDVYQDTADKTAAFAQNRDQLAGDAQSDDDYFDILSCEENFIDTYGGNLFFFELLGMKVELVYNQSSTDSSCYNLYIDGKETAIIIEYRPDNLCANVYNYDSAQINTACICCAVLMDTFTPSFYQPDINESIGIASEGFNAAYNAEASILNNCITYMNEMERYGILYTFILADSSEGGFTIMNVQAVG